MAEPSEMDGVAPLTVAVRPRMKEGIADQLRRLIIEGTLPPGTVLRQEHLAKRLNVSRTPLREALVALEREGFVTFAPSGTASVVSLDAADAREIMDLREMVDGLAARTLAQRGMSAEVEETLRALATRMHAMAARDKHRYLTANADFHVTIVEATGHARLQQFVPLVRMSAEVVYVRLQNQGLRLRTSADEHSAVLDAIAAGDGDAAERLARAHVRAAAAHWIEEDEDAVRTGR